jgi:hypothetical protein
MPRVDLNPTEIHSLRTLHGKSLALPCERHISELPRRDCTPHVGVWAQLFELFVH